MIGGNIEARIQVKTTEKNEIGERVPSWKTIAILWGYLDFMGQSTNSTNFKTKLEESTHIFICDYVELEKNVENKRMLINDEVYDITFIDNPMNLNKHLEIFLEYKGRQ